MYLLLLFLFLINGGHARSKINKHNVEIYFSFYYITTTQFGNENIIVENAIGIITTNEIYQFGDIIHVFNSNHKLKE